MRVQRISYSQYIPTESIEWGSKAVSDREPLVSTVYVSDGIYAWEDGYVTEGREVVKFKNPRSTGYYRWSEDMVIGEVYKEGTRWVAYKRSGEVLGKYGSKTNACVALYEQVRVDRAMMAHGV